MIVLKKHRDVVLTIVYVSTFGSVWLFYLPTHKIIC